MRKKLLTASASGALLAGCATMENPEMATANGAVATAAIPQATGYFAKDSDLPFLAPDFTASQRCRLLARL